MATTALIVEILVIGAFALIWVALFVISIFGLDESLISDWVVLYKDWSTGIILMSIAVAYQLGWSVNQLSYFFARKTFNKTIRVKVFKDEHKNFDSIKNKVLMQGSSFVVEKIQERLSVVRLTRSAFLNFLLISIGLFALGKWQVGLATLGISIILFIQANDMYTLYCHQIFNAYKVINPNLEKQGNNEDLKPVSKSRRTKRAADGGDSAR
jgi:hypothetical protein